MFRSKATDDSEYVISIQGSRARSTCSNISSILFRNFDNDSETVYDMAKIAVRDHYGNSNQNGFGDIVFETKRDDTTDLKHSMSVINSGQVVIGDNCISDTSEQVLHSLLTVQGALDVQELRLSSKDTTDRTYLPIARAKSSSIDAVDFHGGVNASRFAVNEGVGRLFTVSGDGRAKKLNPNGLGKLDEYEGSNLSPFRAIALDEGQLGQTPYLYISDLEEKIYKINARTMQKVDEYNNMESVAWVLLVANGYLYAGLDNGEIHKIDMSDMSQVEKRKNHDQRVTSLIYLASNDAIISGSFGTASTIQLISAVDLEPQQSVDTDGSIWALALENNSNTYIYSGGDAQQVDKRSTVDLSIVESYTGHTSRVEDLHFGHDGFLYSCSLDETARKIDPSDMSEKAVYAGLETRHLAIVLGSQGRVYVSGDGGLLHQLNANDMSFVASFEDHDFEIIGLAFGMRIDNATDYEGKPSITWTTDDDTGFYLADANTVGLSTGGTERLRVNSNLMLSSVDFRAPQLFVEEEMVVGGGKDGECKASSPSDPARLMVYGAIDAHELRFSDSNCEENGPNFAMGIGKDDDGEPILEFRGDVSASKFLIKTPEGDFLESKWTPWNLEPHVDQIGIADIAVHEARFSVRDGNWVILQFSVGFRLTDDAVESGNPPKYPSILKWKLPEFEAHNDTSAKIKHAIAFEKEAGSPDEYVMLMTLYNNTVRVPQNRVKGKATGLAFVDPTAQSLSFELEHFFTGKWEASGTCSYRYKPADSE